MDELTDEGRAALAGHLIDVPWAVYLRGLNSIVSCPELCPGVHTCRAGGPSFTREAAFAFARGVGRTGSTTASGVMQQVEIEPCVLHYGIVWTVESGSAR